MMKMKAESAFEIIDITDKPEHENYLYRCLAPMPFRRYARRHEYLKEAVPQGFHKKILIFGDIVVGSIEYAPAGASGYPITGDRIVVMNCVWVLRTAKGHGFGKLLVEDMAKSEVNANGFATIALEGHWSPWFKRPQIEKLGFEPLDSIKVTHKAKYHGKVFSVYLMWMPRKQKAKSPTMDWQKLLEGEVFCMAHPLYRPQTWRGELLESR
jgi:GNAT superfamily N-acetyltransferase